MRLEICLTPTKKHKVSIRASSTLKFCKELSKE